MKGRDRRRGQRQVLEPPRLKNKPHRVTQLAPGNRIPINLDKNPLGPKPPARTPQRLPTIHHAHPPPGTLSTRHPAQTHIFIHEGRGRAVRSGEGSREADVAAGRADAARGPRRQRSAAVLLWRRVSACSEERSRPGTFSQSKQKCETLQTASVSVCELRMAIC